MRSPSGAINLVDREIILVDLRKVLRRHRADDERFALANVPTLQKRSSGV
jgi:hypothetical protein